MRIDTSKSLIYYAYHAEDVEAWLRQTCKEFSEKAAYLNKIKIMQRKGVGALPYTIADGHFDYDGAYGQKVGFDTEALKEGDRVYVDGFSDDWKPQRFYGTLHKNIEYPHVSEWYIRYDDGQEFAVLDNSLVFKA